MIWWDLFPRISTHFMNHAMPEVSWSNWWSCGVQCASMSACDTKRFNYSCWQISGIEGSCPFAIQTSPDTVIFRILSFFMAFSFSTHLKCSNCHTPWIPCRFFLTSTDFTGTPFSRMPVSGRPRWRSRRCHKDGESLVRWERCLASSHGRFTYNHTNTEEVHKDHLKDS